MNKKCFLKSVGVKTHVHQSSKTIDTLFYNFKENNSHMFIGDEFIGSPIVREFVKEGSLKKNFVKFLEDTEFYVPLQVDLHALDNNVELFIDARASHLPRSSITDWNYYHSILTSAIFIFQKKEEWRQSVFLINRRNQSFVYGNDEREMRMRELQQAVMMSESMQRHPFANHDMPERGRNNDTED